MRVRQIIYRGIFGLVLLVSLLIAYFVVVSLLRRWRDDVIYSSQRFERELWLSSIKVNSANNPRGPMMNDVIRHHLRKEMTRKEVLNLLGPPNPDDHVYLDERYFAYYIGQWSSHPYVDAEYFHIGFDDKGRAVCYGIWLQKASSPLMYGCLD